MPNDRWSDLFKINKIIHSKFADMIFMLPYTPYPGTKLWEKYKGRMKGCDFRKFNLHLPVMGTKHISRRMLDIWFKLSLVDYIALRPRNLIRRIFQEKNTRKKNVQKSLAKKILKLGTQYIWNRIRFRNGYELEYGVKPEWYNK